MTSAFTPYVMSGLALIVVALVALALRRIPEYVFWGITCLAQVLVGASGFLTGNTTAAAISSAGAAYTGWKWWTGGGGDDGRRRLRQLSRRFRGVRRTASAGA